MSTWNDKRLDEGFKEVKVEMRAGFARVDKRFEKVDQRFDKVDQRFDKVDQRFDKVDQEFKDVRQEMKEGFAQMRGDMNQRLNILTGFISALIVAVVGAGILG